MAKKKSDTGDQAAVFGAKSVLKILFYVLVIIVMIYLAQKAYSFGYAIFNQEPVAEAPGQAVTVIIPEDSTVKDIARTLERKGLIEDDAIFLLQERLSGYHGRLLPGTYLLNTSMTADEMMEILSGDNPDGILQSASDSEENTSENDAIDKVEE